MVEKKRKLRNLLQAPKAQFSFVYYVAMGGLVAIATFAVVFTRQYSKFNALIDSQTSVNEAAALELSQHLAGLYTASLAAAIVSVFIIAALAFIVSHRWVGPVTAILAQIEELKNGNYKARRSLRPSDEFQSVMTALNQLAENLENKKS